MRLTMRATFYIYARIALPPTSTIDSVDELLRKTKARSCDGIVTHDYLLDWHRVHDFQERSPDRNATVSCI